MDASKPANAAHRQHSPRIRASCDYCRSMKMRCSQDKPACARCARRNFVCVYSPSLQTGRPLKNLPALPTFATTTDNEFESVTSNSSTMSMDISPSDSSSRCNGGTCSPTVPTTPISSDLDGDSGFGFVRVHTRRSTNDGSETLALDGHGFDGSSHVENNWVSILDVSTRPSQEPSELIPPLRVGLGDLMQPPPTLLGLQMEPGSPDCYMKILNQATEFAQVLSQFSPGIPTLDCLVKTASVVRALKTELLQCKHTTSCLLGDKPSLVTLMLFMESVISKLEATVRMAAALISELDVTGHTETHQQHRAGRMFRSLLNQPCSFPVPCENFEITFGTFDLQGPAKARASKSMLQIQVRKLLLTVQDLQAATVQMSGVQKLEGRSLIWKGNPNTTLSIARPLIEDLMRRLEALQGGLTLLG